MVAAAMLLGGCDGLPKPNPTPDRTGGATLPPPASQPATAQEWASIVNQLDDARAERDRKAAELTARASNEAKIIDGTRWLGLAMIPGGIACAIFISRKLGLWIAAAGAMCLMLGVALGRVAPWIEWASAAGIIGGALYGVGSAFTSLWMRWKTDRQADAQDKQAQDYEDRAAEVDSVNKASALLARAAALRASAAQLRHVGKPNYDATRVDPSAKAVALATGEP